MANHTATTPAPASAPTGTPRLGVAEPPRVYGLMAEFETPEQIYQAAEKVRDAGFKWWDCHTPFPVHGLDKAMGIKPTILPIIAFGGGLTGTILAFSLQILTNSYQTDLQELYLSGYNYMISGKPFISLPAFIPVAFELTILLTALTVIACVLLLNNLPQHYHPVFKSKRFHRATDDRFFLVIEARDPKFSRTKTEELLRSLHPASLEILEA